MATGRAARFEERRLRVTAVFGNDAEKLRTVAHVLELLELAWHDSYAEITPPEVSSTTSCSARAETWAH